MLENGKKENSMDKDFFYIQMDLSSKGNGKKAKESHD